MLVGQTHLNKYAVKRALVGIVSVIDGLSVEFVCDAQFFEDVSGDLIFEGLKFLWCKTTGGFEIR